MKIKKLLIGLIVLLVFIIICTANIPIGKILPGKVSGTTNVLDIKLNLLEKEPNAKLGLFKGEDGNLYLENKGMTLYNVDVDDRIILSDSQGNVLGNSIHGESRSIWKRNIILHIGFPIGFPPDFCDNILDKDYSNLRDTLTTKCKEIYKIKSNELDTEIEVVLESWIRHPSRLNMKI